MLESTRPGRSGTAANAVSALNTPHTSRLPYGVRRAYSSDRCRGFLSLLAALNRSKPSAVTQIVVIAVQLGPGETRNLLAVRSRVCPAKPPTLFVAARGLSS